MVLKKSPKWIPAQLKGEKVRCRFNLPNFITVLNYFPEHCLGFFIFTKNQ